MNAIEVGIAAMALAAVGTWRVRRYALRRRLLDIPNARSSHDVPTPRGGGLGVVVGLLVVFVMATRTAGPLPPVLIWPLLGILVVAVIGWQDDRSSIGVVPRLLCHVIGAGTLLPLVLSPDPLPAVIWPLAAAAWLFWGVSAINVVNFMDGIDGFVGSQSFIFGVHLAILGGAQIGGTFGAALAGASAGFLLWNWPPARIFLGDVGSGALGLAMVFGGALVARHARVPLIIVFLPLFPMFLDASVTLLRRLFRGERITDAHRSHLYQVLANGGWGHLRVTSLYAFAAAVGIAVAHARDMAAWPLIVAAYVVGVALVGFWLSVTHTSRR